MYIPALYVSVCHYVCVLHSIPQLLEHYLSMLSTAGVFQSQFNPNDMELGQSIMRVLLAAVAHQNKEVHV